MVRGVNNGCSLFVNSFKWSIITFWIVRPPTVGSSKRTLVCGEFGNQVYASIHYRKTYRFFICDLIPLFQMFVNGVFKISPLINTYSRSILNFKSGKCQKAIPEERSQLIVLIGFVFIKFNPFIVKEPEVGFQQK